MGRSNEVGAIPYEKANNVEYSLFQKQGRITRKAFFFRLFLCALIWLIFHAVYVYWIKADYIRYTEISSEKMQFNAEKIEISYVFFQFFNSYVIPCLLAMFITIQAIKRVHDVNKSGWYLLLPFYNLFLILIKGTDGDNDYGLVPYAGKRIPKYSKKMIENQEFFTKIKRIKRNNNIKYLAIIIAILLATIIGGITYLQIEKNREFNETKSRLEECINEKNIRAANALYQRCINLKPNNDELPVLKKQILLLEKEKLDEDVELIFEEAKSFVEFAEKTDNSYYKDAIEYCDSALKLQPNNTIIRNFRDSIKVIDDSIKNR